MAMTLRLPEDLEVRLARLASDTRRPRSQLIQQAVERLLDVYPEPLGRYSFAPPATPYRDIPPDQQLVDSPDASRAELISQAVQARVPYRRIERDEELIDEPGAMEEALEWVRADRL